MCRSPAVSVCTKRYVSVVELKKGICSMSITKKRVAVYALGLVATIFVLFAAYVALSLNWSSSSGERAGFLQKMSHKGWVCKTWEGELSLIAIPGTAPEKFLFSVRDDVVAKRLEAAMGKRVTLLYEQHKGVPSSCFGETEYFVVDLREVSP